jgi:hypothetical protein
MDGHVRQRAIDCNFPVLCALLLSTGDKKSSAYTRRIFCRLVNMGSTSIVSTLVAVTLVMVFADQARAQPLGLLSLWRHVGDDGFALAPCSDAGAIVESYIKP